MVDIVDSQTRSRMMSGIRNKNTKPEMLIRKALHSKGFRYRIHVKDLPGKPDLVFPKYHAVVFIHGCFWHGHACSLFKMPATNVDFWRKKINRNREVDERAEGLLLQNKWRVLQVWECALRGQGKLPFDILITKITDWLLNHEGFDGMYEIKA